MLSKDFFDVFYALAVDQVAPELSTPRHVARWYRLHSQYPIVTPELAALYASRGLSAGGGYAEMIANGTLPRVTPPEIPGAYC